MSNPCPEAARLLEIYTALLRKYEAALAAVPASQSHPDYDRLNEARKQELERVFAARKAHLMHLTEHRCGKPIG